MSQTQKQQSTSIIHIIDKPYEQRTSNQHSRLVQFLIPYFTTTTPKMIRFLSFYIQKSEGPTHLTHKDYPSQSFVILCDEKDSQAENPQAEPTILTLTKEKKISIQDKQCALILQKSHYLNIQALGESSVQQQIDFMHSSQFLCSVPKKRLYQILSKSDIVRFSTSQSVYCQGQKIQQGQSGSGVYLVRKGDFGYFKYSQKEGKQIQVLQFSKGHLFGALQLPSGNNKQHFSYQRQFTVKCKTSVAIVYRIPYEIFINYVKPYSEAIINSKQDKLLNYIQRHLSNSQKIRSQKNSYLSQTITQGFIDSKRFSNSASQLPLLKRKRLSLPQKEGSYVLQLESKIVEEGQKKTNYLSIKKQGSIKVHPLFYHKSSLTQSEFKEFNRLQQYKQKIERLKGVTMKNKGVASKSQIMFSFFKQTWNFDKTKKQMAQKIHRY